jgi:hypothetical protein
LVANDGWVARPVKARQPPKAGAAGPPLQGLPPAYSATEVDGWQHKLSRVSQNRAAVHFL